MPVELGDEGVEKKLLGYRSRAEFVAEAVSNKVLQVEKYFHHFFCLPFKSVDSVKS